MGKTISRISIFFSNFDRLFTLQTLLRSAWNFVKKRFRQFSTFHCSTPKAKKIEILVGLRHLFFMHFCDVFEQVRQNQPHHPPTVTIEKKTKKQSTSKMKDQVMTIKTHTESSKSELSSRGKRPFKVFRISSDLGKYLFRKVLDSMVSADCCLLCLRGPLKQAFAWGVVRSFVRSLFCKF